MSTKELYQEIEREHAARKAKFYPDVVYRGEKNAGQLYVGGYGQVPIGWKLPENLNHWEHAAVAQAPRSIIPEMFYEGGATVPAFNECFLQKVSMLQMGGEIGNLFSWRNEEEVVVRGGHN